MGKNGFLTPKAIANRMKSKGLQRLRWYCQMCQKQCRDENGFKCHLKSEGHQRQMQVFGQAPERIVQGYSQEFEDSFLQHFRTAHRHTRISANVLYNEFIADKNHVHMNSTKWLSLSSFVMYLGRTGKCKVEETPKGWFITLIQKDPDDELNDKLKQKRKRAEEADEIRHDRELKAQVDRAKKMAAASSSGGDKAVEEPSEMLREKSDKPLAFDLQKNRRTLDPPQDGTNGRKKTTQCFFDAETEDAGDAKARSTHASSRSSGPKSAMEEIMEQEKVRRERELASKCWLAEGIVVKILAKELKDAKLYKEKAVVKKTLYKQGRVVGELEHRKSGAVVQVDQQHLETVIPKEGSTVLVVAGPHKGRRAVLRGVDQDKFKARIEVLQADSGARETWAEYEEICKIA